MNDTKGGASLGTRSALLSRLGQAELGHVLSRCTRTSFQKHEQVVRERGEDNNIYLVESGKLGVTQYSGSGREVSYRELHPGDNFGELSAIDGQPRSATVIALVDSDVTAMPFDVFKDLVDSNRAFQVAIMRYLSGMVRKLSDRVYEFSTLSVNNRIHAELLRIAKNHIELDGIARIPSPPTHAQLASRVSCNREAVSREMKRLENAGLAVKAGRKWVVKDLAALQRLVDEVSAV